MRKSLRSQECFHFFANKVQHEGYSGNVRFEGNDLYSYRTVIAKWLPDGSLAVSTRTYSSTTTGHQSDLRRATPSTVKIIYVYEIDIVAGVFRQAQILADELNKQALTARTRGDMLRGNALNIIAAANAYAEALGDPQRLEVPELTPEQAEAYKIAQKAANKARRERQAAREAEALLTNAERLEKWLAGDTSVSTYSLRGVGVKLRWKDDRIETTQGASIPAADAVKLWPLIQRCKAGDKCFTPGQPVGNYQLTKIREDGSIVVGCHDVPYSELERMAKQLQLL